MSHCIVCVKCVTDLHVGSGDVNFEIVDNEVERDPLTGYPMIHASGVKGALREYFEKRAHALVAPIFGSDTRGNTSPGRLKFLSAEMLAIPGRASKGGSPYYLLTTEAAKNRFLEMQAAFLEREVVSFQEQALPAGTDSVEIEGFSPLKTLVSPFGTLYVVEEEALRNISLPVLARNRLDEDGRSTQLWYEEIVPHESLFFFPVLAEHGAEELMKSFVEQLSGKIVQFGGNASIGYGLCKLSILEGDHGQKES